MQDQPDGDAIPRMHPATVLLRQILELNEVMEFAMRREMSLNETDFQAMQHLIKHRSMSPGELAQFLHLTAAATTTVIDLMPMILDVDAKVQTYNVDCQAAIVDYLVNVADSMNERAATLEVEPQQLVPAKSLNTEGR